jgi:predicted nucleic acid-binding protein
MRISLDTNRYTDFQRGDPGVVHVLEAAEKGAERFLAKSGVGVLYVDERTTHVYAELYHQLRRQGTPIPTNDIWIAAITLQHGLTLYSRDAHFDHLPQVPRV